MDFHPQSARPKLDYLEYVSLRYMAPYTSRPGIQKHDYLPTEIGYASGSSQNFFPDPIDSFFKGKTIFQAKCVEDIVGLIDEREQLRESIHKRIDYDYCGVKTRLHALEDFHDGLNPNTDKMKTNIYRELGALEKEKRMEDVACWRDVTRLKGDLRDALRELDQEKRKYDLLK